VLLNAIQWNGRVLCSDLLVRYSSSHASMTSVSAADSSGINQPAESAKLRAVVSSCLEGVAQTTALFCSRYSHRLWHFLKALGICLCILV